VVRLNGGSTIIPFNGLDANWRSRVMNRCAPPAFPAPAQFSDAFGVNVSAGFFSSFPMPSEKSSELFLCMELSISVE
jgi:hypothetical protein